MPLRAVIQEKIQKTNWMKCEIEDTGKLCRRYRKEKKIKAPRIFII